MGKYALGGMEKSFDGRAESVTNTLTIINQKVLGLMNRVPENVNVYDGYRDLRKLERVLLEAENRIDEIVLPLQ